jgi:hypothetical protein
MGGGSSVELTESRTLGLADTAGESPITMARKERVGGGEDSIGSSTEEETGSNVEAFSRSKLETKVRAAALTN